VRGARILFAITGHGYGHATRSLAVAREIQLRYPETSITYSTSVSREFLVLSGAGLISATGSPAELYRPQDYEPGTVERSCFEVDPDATRQAYRSFAAERESRIAREAEFLREGRYTGVISDIAAVPIAAAARVGIPAIAISNFTWDWILDPLLRDDPALVHFPGILAGDYGKAGIYLRLPLHPREHPFRRAIDLPLVGRPSRRSAAEIRRSLGLENHGGRFLVLVAIGGLRAGSWPPVLVEGCREMMFLVVGDLPLRFSSGQSRILPDRLEPGLGFTDLVRAVDAVVGKTGYGICSECAVNGTPLVGVERLGFAEYGALKEGLGRFVPFRELSLREFFAGRWEPALSEVLQANRPAPGKEKGAAAAARWIGRIFGLR